MNELSAIEPYTSVKFNLDRTIKDTPKRKIGDRSLLNTIRACVNEFKRDGASHSWSTFRIDGVVDNTMNDESASVIISQLDDEKYFFRVKFIIRLESGDL